MAITISTVYSGEVLENILTLATTGNEVVDGGHIRVIPNVELALEIPRLKLGQIIQDRQATPTSPTGTFDFTPRSLTVKDYMVYTEFNPRTLESYWRKWQPSGNLVYRDLPADVQVEMAGIILKKVDEFHGQAIWTGKNTATAAAPPFDKFDGIITLASAASETIKIATPVALTAANVVSKLDLVHKAVPKSIKKNPGLKYFISTTTWQLYEEALIALQYKGISPSETALERYRGVQLVVLAGFPDDCIYAAIGNASGSSNLLFGCALQNDQGVLQVERLQANSELYFFKMLMKAGTQIGFPEETVLYKA